MCDEIYIMYRGRFVEKGKKHDIYTNPQHIYTKRLIAAIPEVNPAKRDINRQNRLLVEKEYREKEKFYYDEKGKVFDLRPVDPTKQDETHFVAIREVK